MAANPHAILPTGHQHEMRHGEQHAVVTEVGAALRTYTAAGADVLDGFAEDEMASAARGCPLIPWPNRLHGGQYTWDGQQHQTPINEPAQGNSLHGFTRFLNWTAQEHGGAAVTMALRLHGQQGYPFVLDLSVRYALGDDGLTVTTTARNVGRDAAPYAMGAHPYLTVGTDTVDTALLQFAAAAYLPTDESQIPTGQEPVDDTPFDFRARRPVGGAEIDHAFTDLDRDADGRAWLEVSHPDEDRGVRFWADDQFSHVMVFTTDTVPEERRRRRGLGVEPMTAPPNAFASGDGVRRLEPGDELVTTWGLIPTPR